MDGWFFSKHPNLWCRWAQSSPPSSPPSSSQRPPHPPLWMGSLEKKKKSSLDFEGWHFKWSWGSYKGGEGVVEYWYQFTCKNREVKGHYQLFVEGEPEGDRPRPLLTPEIILNAVTCVCTASRLLRGEIHACWYSNYLQNATFKIHFYFLTVVR